MLCKFEEIIDYKFKNKQLIQSALTHTSFGATEFEFLEFLGDRVLGLVISEILYNKTNNSLKELASKYTKLVSGECLKQVAFRWKLDKFVKHSIQNLSSKVLVDAAEAVIGAIYLDSNYSTVYKIIDANWQEFCSLTDYAQPKLVLQELLQAKGSLPIYKTISSAGPDHAKEYTVQVTSELGQAVATGNSKHSASKKAAINLLKKLKFEGKM